MAATQGLDGYTVLLTDKAAQIVREAFEAEKVDPSNGYVRVGAAPGGCSGYKYVLDFATPETVKGDDVVFDSRGVKLVVDRGCLTDILGSVEIDYQDKNMVEQGFKFRPLNDTATCGCGESFQPVKKGA